jgi:hypothetical protein
MGGAGKLRGDKSVKVSAARCVEGFCRSVDTRSGHIFVVHSDPVTRRALTSYLLEHELPAIAVASEKDLLGRLAVSETLLVIVQAAR